MIPTLAPVPCSASARFTATVDLPTPPLPEDTAMVCLTSGIMSAGRWGAAGAALGACPCAWPCWWAGAAAAPAIFALTFDTPGKRPTSLDAMLWIMTFVCGGWAANASVKLTSPPWMATSRTSPSATMSFWLSGSLMPRSVSKTSCSLAIRTNDIPDGPDAPNGNAGSQSEACSYARHREARAQAVEKTPRLAWNADCCQMERPSRRESSQVVRSMPSPRRGRACQGPPSLDFHLRFLLHSSGGRSRRVSPGSRSLRHRRHHRYHPGRGWASPRPPGERVLFRLARSAADPRVRASQITELSGAARRRTLRRQLPGRRSRRDLAPLRDDAPRQIRRRGAPPERPRRAADRGRAGAARVPRGVQARRGRSHDSHRTG